MHLIGEIPKWLKGSVLKTDSGVMPQLGFESLFLRHFALWFFHFSRDEKALIIIIGDATLSETARYSLFGRTTTRVVV